MPELLSFERSVKKMSKFRFMIHEVRANFLRPVVGANNYPGPQ